MNDEELYEEWREGETGLRPARIQTLRDELQEATGMYVPRRTPEIESWLDRMQGTVTRKLKKAAGVNGDE